jgi:hypothetical protein
MLLGGLAMRMPVEGFTIGIALVPDRMADGWWTFRELLLTEGEMKAEEVADKERWSGCICCCNGEDSGEPLDSEERSEPEETDCF